MSSTLRQVEIDFLHDFCLPEEASEENDRETLMEVQNKLDKSDFLHLYAKTASYLLPCV